MLFDYAQAKPGQTVLIHGAAGNVGAYAVQLASQAGLQVFATASSGDAPYLQSLGATTVIDYKTTRFEEAAPHRHRWRRYAGTFVRNYQAGRHPGVGSVRAYA
jgi:NADPH:quinone reductase-like Zn-dependent oxidoreductase